MSDQQGGPVKCPHCERTFPNVHGLKVHVARAHGEKLPGDDAEARLDTKRARDRAGYARRKAEKAALVKASGEAKPARLVRQVNFCPHCGQNVHLVAQAMAIAEGLAHG